MFSIEVRNLYKTYDKTTFKQKLANVAKLRKPSSEYIVALDHITFSVRRGEVFGFLGPNGAGKTTTVKILTTILTPDSGYASVMGYDVVKDSLEVRKRIGVLPEDAMRGFYWRLSAYDNLYFYAVAYEVPDPKNRVKEVLELVDLDKDAWGRWYQRLSQGMKQKVALARALLPDPEVLFLDEPTKGLDILFTARFREMVKEHFGDKDRTIFLSTHDMKLVEETCDKVAVINKGRVIAVKGVEELKSLMPLTSRQRFRIEFTGTPEDRIEEFVKNIRALSGVEWVEKKNSRVEYIVSEDEVEVANEILKLALNNGLKIASFTRAELDIEEAILQLLGGRCGS